MLYSNKEKMQKRITRVTLKSEDGELFEVSAMIAVQSKVLRHIIEEEEEQRKIFNFSEYSSVQIPVSGDDLRLIIAFCQLRLNAAEKASKSEVTGDEGGSRHYSNMLGDEESKAWESKLNEIGLGSHVRLLEAANYLDIEDLVDFACRKLAGVINQMNTPREIRDFFGIIEKGSNDGSIIIPGLCQDLALTTLAMVSPVCYGLLECVSDTWRDIIRSDQFVAFKASKGWCGNLIFAFTEMGDKCHAYDTEADRWRQLPVMPVSKRIAHGPHSMEGYKCVAVCNKVVVIGGCTSITDVLDGVYLFDPFRWRWRSGARMRRGRYNFGCAEVCGKIYVAGGMGIWAQWLHDAEVYDPLTDRWEDLPSLPVTIRSPYSWSEGTNFIVVGVDVITKRRRRFSFDTLDNRWDDDDDGDDDDDADDTDDDDPAESNHIPVPVGRSFMLENKLYSIDKETVEALQQPASQKGKHISASASKWAKEVLKHLTHPFGAIEGHCVVGCRRRLYQIGGMNWNGLFLTPINSAYICDEIAWPQRWRSGRQMAYGIGYVQECAQFST